MNLHSDKSSYFLDKKDINSFSEIIEIIQTCGITPGTIAIEHIGDILFFLNQRDKKRNMDDPELKKAAFTIIKTLLDLEIVDLLWRDSWVENVRNNPPNTQKEIFEFLDYYWDKKHSSGLDRNYLLFFKKKGQSWPY
ncbi:MAG: hypothetical protein EOO90_19260 [Pedobacter sp.]|nr:MAG: hypothetical protein EOO90_19260 [Pedobacter sp.]